LLGCHELMTEITRTCFQILLLSCYIQSSVICCSKAKSSNGAFFHLIIIILLLLLLLLALVLYQFPPDFVPICRMGEGWMSFLAAPNFVQFHPDVQDLQLPTQYVSLTFIYTPCQNTAYGCQQELIRVLDMSSAISAMYSLASLRFLDFTGSLCTKWRPFLSYHISCRGSNVEIRRNNRL